MEKVNGIIELPDTDERRISFFLNYISDTRTYAYVFVPPNNHEKNNRPRIPFQICILNTELFMKATAFAINIINM